MPSDAAADPTDLAYGKAARHGMVAGHHYCIELASIKALPITVASASKQDPTASQRHARLAAAGRHATCELELC